MLFVFVDLSTHSPHPMKVTAESQLCQSKSNGMSKDAPGSHNIPIK